MSTPHVDVPREAVLQKARHVLFVEGKLEEELLRDFLPAQVQIRRLGAAFGMRSAANALRDVHPEYLFLIDRDRQDEAAVASAWAAFENRTANLILWQRKEFENYFLIPEYLEQSRYVRPGVDVRAAIRRRCGENLYRDAANFVLVDLCSRVRATPVELFANRIGLATRDEARQSLLNHADVGDFVRNAKEQLSRENLSRCFEETVDRMTGGIEPIEFGRGEWLELTSGKSVLPAVINECFQPATLQGEPLQGERAGFAVLLDLIRKPLGAQPADFRRLHELISNRLA